MSVQTRPIDITTKDNLLIGVPFVEFAPKLSGGGFGSFRSMGIVQDAAIAKSITRAALKSSHSGVAKLVREIVQEIEARLRVDLFQFGPDNMQLFMGSATLTNENAGTTAVVDEKVTLPSSATEFASLVNLGVSAPITSVDPDTITAEAVGTGDGATGTTKGDFALDFKPKVIGDVTSFKEGGTERVSALVAGSTPSAGEIGIVVGTGADAGDITYPAGEAPANGDALVATYTPSHTLVEDTDFSVDYPDGRIRRISGSSILKAKQPLLVDYSYTTFDGKVLAPFSQLTFPGKCRLRLLTDIGINLIWTVPLVDVTLTDEDFAFSREEFATGQLNVTLRDDGTSQPFGTMRLFEEGASI